MLSRRTAVPMLDLLFLLLCWIVLLINPGKMDAAKPVADFALYVVWPMGRDTDLDIYVQGPDRKIVWFRTKDVGYMSVDRDDLGSNRDRGAINQEIVSFREPDGNYLVSIHNYRDESLVSGQQVAFELMSRAGTVVWQDALIIPENNEEIPVIEFEFENKNFVRSWPSNTLIRYARGAEGA